MNIQAFTNQDMTIAAAGQALADILLSYKAFPTLLLSSGGSALELLNRIPESAMGEHLTVTVMDERFTQDEKVNNFTRLQKTDFYEMALSQNVNFFGTLPRPEETLEQAGKRFEERLKKWRQQHPTGKIVATFGMGKDGHTAGIFPYPDNPEFFKQLFESENWIAAYTAFDKHEYPERITGTFPLFSMVDDAVALICGREKAEAFNRFKENSQKLNELPVLGLYKIKNLQVFTDIV